MNDYYIKAAVLPAGLDGTMTEVGVDPLENILSSLPDLAEEYAYRAHERPVTMAELRQILSSLLSGIRVYVLESDITSSQDAMRAIVEQSQF